MYAVVRHKGADAADRVTDERLDLIGRKHLCLCMKGFLILVVVDARVPRCHDENNARRGHKRHGLGDVRAVTAERRRGKLDRCA